MNRWLALSAVSMFMAACGVSSLPPRSDCGFDFQASLSRLDAATGEVRDAQSVGWPSLQDPILHDGTILEIETGPDSLSLVVRGEDLAEQWSVLLGDVPYAQDLQVHDNMAFVTDETTVTAISLDDREIAWSHSFSSSRISPPAVSDGGVFVPAGRKVTALDLDGGAVVWSRTFESHPITPIATGDLVISGASRPSHGAKVGPLRALDAATGDVAWRTRLPGRRTFRPRLIESRAGVITDMEVRLGGTRTKLISIDEDSGQELWRRTFERDGIWEFVFHRGPIVVVPAGPARVKALDVATGETLYGVAIPRGWALFDAALRGDELLLTSRNRRAIDVRGSDQGELVWKTRIEAARIPRLAGPVGNGTLLTLIDQQEIHRGDLARLDPEGDIAWRTRFPQALVMKPVVTEDAMFVLSADPLAGCV